ncbi:hypothetical protein D3C86_1515640 [compost metagenome]
MLSFFTSAMNVPILLACPSAPPLEESAETPHSLITPGRWKFCWINACALLICVLVMP